MALEELRGRHILALKQIELYSNLLENTDFGEKIEEVKNIESDISVRLTTDECLYFVNEFSNGDEAIFDELKELCEMEENMKLERKLIASKREETREYLTEMTRRMNALEVEREDLNQKINSLEEQNEKIDKELVDLCNTNIANDSFHIWYSGPFVTINTFRVGRLPNMHVGWPEINAGLGQAAIALNIVRSSMKLVDSKYAIVPLGSSSKVLRVEDGKVLYNLFSDERFSLFPRKNLNMALKIFLLSINEAGKHAVKTDPTLQLPFKINEAEGTVGKASVSMGGDLKMWTRAMKYMLTDLKWLLAWVAKYNTFSENN